MVARLSDGGMNELRDTRLARSVDVRETLAALPIALIEIGQENGKDGADARQRFFERRVIVQVACEGLAIHFNQSARSRRVRISGQKAYRSSGFKEVSSRSPALRASSANDEYRVG